MGREDDVIRASEIGQYAYCARAWWLARVKGARSANVEVMRQGTARHQAHGRTVAGAYRLRRVAVALLVAGGLLLAAWLIAGLGG